MVVSPQLLNEIRTFLQGSRADKTALAALYQNAFAVGLNTGCGVCINEGIKDLQKLLTHKEQNGTMGAINYKWTSDKRYEKATVVIKPSGGGKAVIVHKGNLTDALAETIYRMPKYSHLVEAVQQPEEKQPEPVGNVEPASNGSEASKADTLTSTEQKPEENPAKLKKQKRR